MSDFPFIDSGTTITTIQLPLAQDVAWDFENDCFLLKGGNFVYVYGADALKVWVYKALRTEMSLYGAYTNRFGQQVYDLTGRDLHTDFVSAEAKRYTQEALLANPYITSVIKLTVTIDDDIVSISATVNTVYGEVTVSV